MNTYSTKFYARCPSNGVRIEYALEIRTDRTIPVENIVAVVSGLTEGYHEQFAETLRAAFGGVQTLDANHHSVNIRTHRSGISSDGRAWLDAQVMKAPQPAAAPAGKPTDDQFRDVVQFNGVTIKHDAAPQPASEPTDQQIEAVWLAMPGGPAGWLKEFGYMQFARAVLELAEGGDA